ncbi:fluoride efflux transporter CrcB [Wenjunlia vitaminophila]|uniref:fluoride efflux transporter CrcB n=1 Tax=Wenjunlia vitaminophila TaxID=76728 RepID=UPI000371DDF5|nr:fluoride efflux transporter CrcB [Wenjunlia vitaminophila]
MTVLLVALGAAVGGPLRYLTDRWLSARYGNAFPWGTLAVNVSGSLALGVVLRAAPPDLRLLLGTGLCGGLTTFSSFGHQTLLLFETGRAGRALLNVGANLAAGLAAVTAGWALGGAL